MQIELMLPTQRKIPFSDPDWIFEPKEGIVGKKADSVYVGGRTKDWVKIKTRVSAEVMKKRVETWGR